MKDILINLGKLLLMITSCIIGGVMYAISPMLAIGFLIGFFIGFVAMLIPCIGCIKELKKLECELERLDPIEDKSDEENK